MKVIDSFLYNGEKDMLLIRLLNYNEYVDYFIIIEGDKTFTNNKKDRLFIDEIKIDPRFKKYLSKIDFVICRIQSNNPWENEKVSRKSIVNSNIFKSSSDDTIILHSDCDEILRPKTLIKIRNMILVNKIFLLKNIMFCLKWEYPNKVYSCISLLKKTIVMDNDLQKIRLEFRNNINNYYHEEIGWHFSFILPIKDITRKISSFSHQEMNRKKFNNQDYIQNEIINKGNVIDFFTVSWNKGCVPNLKLCNLNDLPKNINIIDYSNIFRSYIGLWNKKWIQLNKIENINNIYCNSNEEKISFLKGINFLSDCKIIEDWGCGPICYFKNFFKNKSSYIGIDGSFSPNADKSNTDLIEYKSNIEGIFMRHILESNFQWRRILNNAVNSFSKKMVLVVFTPFVDETKILYYNEQDNYSGVPTLSFSKNDILEEINKYNITYTIEENIENRYCQYKIENIIYLTKK